jgi:hypothetical protein
MESGITGYRLPLRCKNPLIVAENVSTPFFGLRIDNAQQVRTYKDVLDMLWLQPDQFDHSKLCKTTW